MFAHSLARHHAVISSSKMQEGLFLFFEEVGSVLKLQETPRGETTKEYEPKSRVFLVKC